MRALALLQEAEQHAVLGVDLDRPPHRLVLKAARADAAPAVDLRRTATAMALARSAGAPVAPVVASGTRHPVDSARHRADTASVCRQLGVRPPAG